MKKGKKSMFIRLFLIALICIGVGIFLIGSIKLFISVSVRDAVISMEDATTRDFVIIPGSKVYMDRPSTHLEERLLCGISLYKQNKVKKIIISGGFAKNIQKMETDIMYEYLIKNEIPTEDIYIDNYGIDTYNTMKRSSVFIDGKSTYICTQKMYANRTQFLAQNAGLNALTIKADLKVHVLRPWLYIREFLAPTKAFLEVYLKRDMQDTLEEKPFIQK